MSESESVCVSGRVCARVSGRGCECECACESESKGESFTIDSRNVPKTLSPNDQVRFRFNGASSKNKPDCFFFCAHRRLFFLTQ